MSNLKPAPLALTDGIVAKMVGDRPAFGRGVAHVPLVAAARAADTPDSDGQQALDHLLSHMLASRPVSDHLMRAAEGDGQSVRYLAMLGIRSCERGVAIACELPADNVFLWTRWHEVHAQALIGLAGARRMTVRIGGEPTPAILVPFDAPTDLAEESRR